MITTITFLILFIRKFLDILLELVTLTITLKLVLIVILFYIIRFINNYNFENLYEFPDRYILKTYKDHIINIFIILIYPLVFICGILYLRLINMSKTVDLFYYYIKIKSSFVVISNLDITLTIVCLFLIFYIYIILIRGIIKLVRFHFIKRHIYFSNNNYYYNFVSCFSRFRSNFLFNIVRNLETNLSTISAKNKLFFVSRFLAESQYYIHHFIIFFIFVYDLIFNSFLLINIFIILPFIFIYNLWIVLCKFDNGLNPMADLILYHFFYSPSTIIDKSCIQLGPLTVEVETIKKIYMFYIKTDLVYDYELEKYYEDPDNYIRKEILYDKIHKKYTRIKDKFKEIFIKPLQ